jgi:hypothetical protein
MKIFTQILRAFGRIARTLIESRELSDRATTIQNSLWLKAGWTVLMTVWIILIRLALVKP